MIKKIPVKSFHDERGRLLKLYDENSNLTKNNDPWKICDLYLSSSSKNVVRGLHFQINGGGQEKIIHCISGEFLDVSIDLEPGENFGCVYIEHMTPDCDFLLSIPKSFAHGIVSLADYTSYLNMSPQPFNPELERGINFSSLGLDIMPNDMIISEKDLSWPSLEKVLEEIAN